MTIFNKLFYEFVLTNKFKAALKSSPAPKRHRRPSCREEISLSTLIALWSRSASSIMPQSHPWAVEDLGVMRRVAASPAKGSTFSARPARSPREVVDVVAERAVRPA